MASYHASVWLCMHGCMRTADGAEREIVVDVTIPLICNNSSYMADGAEREIVVECVWLFLTQGTRCHVP